jgi:hypothetical protein
MAELLNDEQVKILQQLGMLETVTEALKNAAKPKRRKPRHAKLPDEYLLEVAQKCKLCGSTLSRLYVMERDVDNPVMLVSRLVPMNELEQHTELPYMLENRVVSTCGSCKNFLMAKSKKELISMILKGAWNV